MPVIDGLFLNPFEKWSLYGRFPYAILLHMVLLVCVTFQAALLFSQDIDHVSRTLRHFSHLFLEGSTLLDSGGITLHEPAQLQEAVKRTARNHFQIKTKSVVIFELDDRNILTLSVKYRNGTTQPMHIERAKFFSNGSASGKATDDYMRATLPFLYNLEMLPTVAFITFSHAMTEYGYVSDRPGKVCHYNWKVSTLLDGRAAGEFVGTVEGHARDCRAFKWRPSNFMQLTCLFLALVGMLFMMRKFVQRVRIACRLWKPPVREQFTISLGDITVLFNPWWLCGAVMYMMHMACWTVCLHKKPSINTRFRYVGFCCFMSWLALTQYFESFPGYYMAFHTLGISLGRVFRFLCSVVPLFCGFMFLGVCLFWRSPLFTSPGASAASLFSLMNGDMIHDTFDELYGIEGMLAHLYLYAFLFTFIYVILNVNISIVTDAYERAKRHPQREIARQLRQVRTPPLSPRSMLPEDTASAPPQRSHELRGYMTPRYFGETSGRIQEAIAAVCSDQGPVVGAQQMGASTGYTASMSSMAAVDRRGSSQEGATEAFMLPALSTPLTSPLADSRAIELLPQKDRSWLDFDLLLGEVQGKVDTLRRLAECAPAQRTCNLPDPAMTAQGDSGAEQARLRGMLEPLQAIDPAVESIVVYSKFVVHYLLQQDGPNPGWRKANVEGPVYLVRRRKEPRYQLIVKSQFNTSDLVDALHPDWELDCQKNYVFYKVEDSASFESGDASKRIRGLWFHDDAERQKVEGALEKMLEEIRSSSGEPQTEPVPAKAKAEPEHGPGDFHADNMTSAEPEPGPGDVGDSITMSSSRLGTALRSLANDDTFIEMLMQKLKQTQV